MYISFTGSGNSHSEELGESSAIIKDNKKKPILLIDLGSETYFKIKKEYKQFPDIYITHTHFDHIGGLERLFYEQIFKTNNKKIKIFCHYNLVPLLVKKLSYPNQIAEAGANFFDAFQLIPVEDNFWIESYQFHIFENRHHKPKTSYGLSLPGNFFYSGDTRPIPEIMSVYANNEEIIFHDCAANSNPSHSGI